MRALLFICLTILTLPVFAQMSHVIYITLDGTRWQEFYSPAPFTKLWEKHAHRGVFYGGPNPSMEVASTPISLPSYQSQMSGKVQPCKDNYCGRILVETFPEALKRMYGWPKKDLAIFSSWSKIEFAAQHIPDTVYVNAGNVAVYDPDTQEPDAIMKRINAQQKRRPHPNGNRYDEYTYAQAMHYFDRYRPKFLWIAMVNADDAAHAVNWRQYQQTLAFYDRAIDELITYLKNKKLYDKTMIIITTDHGRGDGHNWPFHGPLYPESRLTWGFVINGKLWGDEQNKHSEFSTLSIQPTVLAAFA